MKLRHFLIGIFALYLLSACADSADFSAVENLQSDIQNSEGIYGGDTVSGQDPIAATTVYLKNSDKNVSCSGSILGPHTILTAAHCVGKSPASALTVLFGVKGNAASRRVVKAVIHSQYISDTSVKDMHDLAILKIAGSLPTGYHPAEFLDDYSVFKVGTPIVVAGYGLSIPWLRMGVGTLRKTNLKIVDTASSATTVFFYQGNIGHGVCFGDSGGPALVKVGSRLKVFGVANRVSPLKGSKSLCYGYSLYTRLDVYKPWIMEKLEMFESQ